MSKVNEKISVSIVLEVTPKDAKKIFSYIKKVIGESKK